MGILTNHSLTIHVSIAVTAVTRVAALGSFKAGLFAMRKPFPAIRRAKPILVVFWKSFWGSPKYHRFIFRIFPEINHPAIGVPRLWKPPYGPSKSWMAAKLLLREDMAQELHAIQRAWGFWNLWEKNHWDIIPEWFHIYILLYIVIIRDDLIVINNTYNYIKNTRQDISVNRFITMLIMNMYDHTNRVITSFTSCGDSSLLGVRVYWVAPNAGKLANDELKPLIDFIEFIYIYIIYIWSSNVGW